MSDIKPLLKKYFKTYINAKETFEKNKEDSYEIFMESLQLLKELKETNSNLIKKHKDLLAESETECHKYLSLSLESSIDIKPQETKIQTNDLYSNLEYGNLDLIKKAKLGEINFNEEINGQTILHWAVKYSDTTFLKLAFKLGAKIDTTNSNGNTLLEFACIEQDPNMINFLNLYGSNMQKHLYFREGSSKCINRTNYIDYAILLKYILSYKNIQTTQNNNIFNKIKLIVNLFDLNEKILLNNYTFKDLFTGLINLLNKIPEESAITYLNIINEELSYSLQNKLGCPTNKIEMILVHLIPFIDYPFVLSIDWLYSLELKFLILKLIKNKKNNLDIKKDLIEKVWETYIKTEIIQEDYIGCLISQWIAKIKV